MAETLRKGASRGGATPLPGPPPQGGREFAAPAVHQSRRSIAPIGASPPTPALTHCRLRRKNGLEHQQRPILVRRGLFPAIRRGASARAGLFLALWALFAQALTLAVPPMAAPGDARHAAVELQALLGPGIVICSQADEPGAPPPPMNCDDRCPICQANAGALAFIAPDPPVHVTPILRPIEALAFPATPRAPPRGPILIAFARGPPSPI